MVCLRPKMMLRQKMWRCLSPTVPPELAEGALFNAALWSLYSHHVTCHMTVTTTHNL